MAVMAPTYAGDGPEEGLRDGGTIADELYMLIHDGWIGILLTLRPMSSA